MFIQNKEKCISKKNFLIELIQVVLEMIKIKEKKKV